MNEIEARWPGSVFEKQLGPATELLHLQVLINYDCCRRVRAENDPICHLQEIGTEIYARGSCRSCTKLRELKGALGKKVRWTRRSPGFLRINFSFLVHEFEKLVIQAHRFSR